MDNPLNRALEPLQLDEEEARELDDILSHPRAYPTVPVRGIPRRGASEMATCEHCHDTGVVTLPLAYEDENGEVHEGVNTIACPYCDLGKFGKRDEEPQE